jgi:hypothetical protein
MDWQQPVSLAVVAVTGFFFIRHQVRSRRKSRSRPCGADCGCAAEDEKKPAEGLSRPNRGENQGWRMENE